MSNLLLSIAASGVLRNAHYVVPTGKTIAERTLLMEPAATNLCLYSADLTDVSWNKTRSSVSANVEMAPDGTLTADRLIEDSTAASTHYAWRTCTIVAGETVAGSAFVKAGPRTWARIAVAGNAGADRIYACINLATGAVGTTGINGAGTFTRAHAAQYVAPDGGVYWRVSVTGVVNGSSTNVTVEVAIAEADNDTTFDGDGASYIVVWGVNLQAGHGSSYIPTAGATVTRAADSLYFDIDFGPQELTVYVRGVEQAMLSPASSVTRRLLHVGAASLGTQPYFSLGKDASDNVFAQYDDGPTNVLAQATPTTAVPGDIVEHRGVLSSDWRATVGYAINGATEVVSAQTGPSGPAAAWGAARVYLTGGLSNNNGAFAYTHIAIAKGTQTLKTMRRLAGLRAV